MRFGVEPVEVTTSAGIVHDLAAQVAVLDARSVGTLVTSGMPESVSARLAGELSGSLTQELAALARDLAVHAHRLGRAAEAYAGAEGDVQRAARDESAASS